MVDTYSDQFGGLDFQRSQHGSGMSGRSQPKKFIAALQRISDQTYNSIFTIEQMQQIARVIYSFVVRKPVLDLYEQQGWRSASASVHSVQHLCCSLPRVYIFCNSYV